MNSEHSPKFEMVKNFYDTGAGNKEAVKNAVVKEWITEEEYKEITGDEYIPINRG